MQKRIGTRPPSYVEFFIIIEQPTLAAPPPLLFIYISIYSKYRVIDLVKPYYIFHNGETTKEIPGNEKNIF